MSPITVDCFAKMSSFLRLLLLLAIAFTITAAERQGQKIPNALNDSVTEQVKGLKEGVSSKIKELDDSDEDGDERIISWGTTPTIIQPTPVTATPTPGLILVDPVPSSVSLPTVTPSTVKPKPPPAAAVTPKPGVQRPPPAAVVTPTPPPTPVTPQTAAPILVDPPQPVALPPPAEVVPTGLKPLCGKRGNCYRWFQDEVELFQDGFSRCDLLNEHWARKYCCVDSATD